MHRVCVRFSVLIVSVILFLSRSAAQLPPGSDIRSMIETFTADQGSLGRYFPLSGSPAATARMRVRSTPGGSSTALTVNGVLFFALNPLALLGADPSTV